MLSTPALLRAAGRFASGSPTRSLLVVGDPTAWLARSRAALDGDPRLEVLGIVDSGQEALALVPQLQPDLVLVDVSPPPPAAGSDAMSGFDLARHLSQMSRGGRTVLTGPQDGLHLRYQAHATGAAGYLCAGALTPDRILALV